MEHGVGGKSDLIVAGASAGSGVLALLVTAAADASRMGYVLGAVLLAALPEVLRHLAGPLQGLTGGRLDASILRQLLIALAMIIIMLMRPRGLWPSPDHGKSLQTSV